MLRSMACVCGEPLVPMIPMSDSLFDQFDHQGESFLIRWEDEDTWSRIPGLALERKEQRQGTPGPGGK